MDLLIVNPNSTASMTAGIGAAAGKVVGPQTTVRAVNPTDTPPAVQGPAVVLAEALDRLGPARLTQPATSSA